MGRRASVEHALRICCAIPAFTTLRNAPGNLGCNIFGNFQSIQRSIDKCRDNYGAAGCDLYAQFSG
jgi:hypothetical protein